MPVDVALDVIYELPDSHVRSTAVLRNRFWISYDITSVGAGICMNESRCSVKPLQMRKIHFLRLQLAAKIFFESIAVLLCNGYSELDPAIDIRPVMIRAAHAGPRVRHELKDPESW